MIKFIVYSILTPLLFCPIFLIGQSNHHPLVPINGDVQKEALSFDHFTVADGLASNEVYYIFQDSYGYLWFGTTNGLSRYDGYRFLNFRNGNNDSLTLSNNRITAIDEDSYGNLWIATRNGLNRYDRANERFEQIYAIPGDLNSPSHDYIRTIYADDDGNLWMETVNSFLDQYKIQQDSFFHFRHAPYRKIVPLHYHAHHIFEARNNTLWIGTRNIGAYTFEKATNEYIQHHISDGDSEWGTNLKALSNNNVTSFFEDDQHLLWIGSSTSPLNIYDQKTGIYHRYAELKDVYHICEIKPGLLWMGTSAKGIFIYDFQEKSLTNVIHDPDNENTLIDNSINYIFVDRSENVWVATDKGVSKYNYNRDRFHRFYHEVGKKNSISENNITALIEDRENNIWVGTLRTGLNKINRTSHEITRYHTANSSISSNRISCLYLDSYNELYVGLMEGIGFDIFDFNEQSFQRFAFHSASTRKDWYKSFLEDSYGNFWIALWGAKGFVEFDRSEKVFVAKNYFNAYNNVRMQHCSNVLPIGKNVFVIHSDMALYAFDVAKQEFHALTNKEQLYADAMEFDRMGMPNYGLQSIPYTYGDIVDIGALQPVKIFKKDNKLFIYDKNEIVIVHPESYDILQKIHFPFDHVFPSIAKNHLWLITENRIIHFNYRQEKAEQEYNLSFHNAGITKAVEFQEGQLCILFHNRMAIVDLKMNTTHKVDLSSDIYDVDWHHSNGLYIATSDGLNYYDTRNHALQNVQITTNYTINSLLVHNDVIFLGTDNGLFYYGINNNKLQLYQNAHFLQNQIFSIALNHKDQLWIGTNEGFGYVDITDSKLHTYNKPIPSNIFSHLSTYLFEDSERKIWIGTADKGVSIFDPEKENFVHLIPEEENERAIHGSYIHFIFEDSEQTMYVGNDVLNIFSPQDSSFRKIIPGSSWLPGKPMAMLEDDHKNLWISTENGLCKYNLKTAASKVYTAEDGLQGNQFTKAHYHLQSGEMMFGGIHGFCLFHPDSLIDSDFEPNIEITQFDVYNTPRFVDFTQKDTVKLHHKQNFFTIHFAAFDYTSPMQNKFKYKLEGVDKDWIVQKENKANYTNISPGHYIFEVQGSNNDGIWSPFKKKLHIVIQPAFWQTLWFKILVVLFVLFGVVYFFIAWLRRIKMMQKNIILEQRLLRSQMNPHFIFNSLTAIQYFIFGNEPARAGKYLSGFAKLIRLILQNSRSESILLEKEIETLEHYFKLQQLRFENKFDYATHVDQSLNPEMILVPPMLAQPYIENSIEHGIKEISYKGEITVDYTLENNSLVVTIEDNGVGIEKSMQEKNVKESSHKSLGTSITRERLMNLAKANKQNISFQIIDKNQADSTKTGTLVKYVLPLKYNL